MGRPSRSRTRKKSHTGGSDPSRQEAGRPFAESARSTPLRARDLVARAPDITSPPVATARGRDGSCPSARIGLLLERSSSYSATVIGAVLKQSKGKSDPASRRSLSCRVRAGRPATSSAPGVCPMEHLWRRAGAVGSNCRQFHCSHDAERSCKQPLLVATACRREPMVRREVDGSSPSEGFEKALQSRDFSLIMTCRVCSVRWAWSTFWRSQIRTVSLVPAEKHSETTSGDQSRRSHGFQNSVVSAD
jgi:hypothetical protein